MIVGITLNWLMKRSDCILQIGNFAERDSGFSNPQIGRVYSVYGICPTITTMGGGSREPKVLLINETQ